MAIEKDTLIKVRNRDNGTVGYTIPDLGNLHRTFQPNEIKRLTFEEIQKLSWVPGGDVILRDFLVIEDNDEAVKEILGQVEPEYKYTEKEIKILLESGSLAQLQDALDFAPQGVIELIKDMAVKLPLNDVAKREAIFKATGFNITKAIEINADTSEDTSQENKSGRRAAPINEGAAAADTSKRRSEPVNYKVVSK